MNAVLYPQALLELARRNEDVVVMTAENRAHLGGVAEALGRRFIDVGVCEQTLVGAAAGLALRGRTPVVHALAAFLTMRAYEFIRTNVGIGNLPVKLVGYVPGLLSEANGPTHQALEDVALMRGIPGVHVFCPADEGELVDALPSILAHPAPCYVRYVGAPRAAATSVPFVYGKALELREGADVAIVTYGTLVHECVAAAQSLSATGVDCGVLHLRMPKPLDEAAVLRAARRARHVVVVEDHFASSGIGQTVGHLLTRHGLSRAFTHIALDERWHVPARLADVLDREGFSAARLAERIRERVAHEVAS